MGRAVSKRSHRANAPAVTLNKRTYRRNALASLGYQTGVLDLRTVRKRIKR
jgi:hypothetical protein